MNAKSAKFSGLSGNQLKIIALVAMTADHIGVQLLPQFTIFRIIGRLAFPIFAFMIAEGCRYTKNRRKYLLSMAGLALACQIVYFVSMQSLYQCVIVSFTLAICMIYVLDNALKRKNVLSWAVAAVAFSAVLFICQVLPRLLTDMNFNIDYGIWGILLPVFIYLGDTKKQQLCLAGADMLILCMTMQGIQWYSFAALLLLALYSGKRGKLKMKYLFYVYYPLHLAAIYGISMICDL